MFSFDGQFKSRPVVALGGTSKKEERASLIKRTQAERLKREALRQQNASAVKIQSFIRANNVRQKLYDEQRAEFDKEVKVLNQTKNQQVDQALMISNILRRLLFFYSEPKDAERLMWTMQYLLRNCSVVSHSNIVCRHDVWIHQIKQLLLLCCRSLSINLRESNPFAVQLRMLEVFSSNEAFQEQDPSQCRQDVTSIVLFLVRNGYFKYLLLLLNRKVPESDELSARPLTPLAEAIANLIVRPIHHCCLSQTEDTEKSHNNQRVCYEVLSYLARDVLCPETSNQVEYFLIPFLADTAQTKFPYSAFLGAILSSSSPAVSSTQEHSFKLASVSASPWLLSAVLRLAGPYMDSLATEGLLRYVNVIQLLLPQLAIRDTTLADEIYDSDEEMETGSAQADRLSDLKNDCLSVLNSRKHVKQLEKLVSTTVGQTAEHGSALCESVIMSVCKICYTLMTEFRLPVATTSLLHSFALNRIFIRELWRIVNMVTTGNRPEDQVPLIQIVTQGRNLSVEEAEKIVPALSLFCFLFSRAVLSVHDHEFYGGASSTGKVNVMPFGLRELVPMTAILRDVTVGVIDNIYPESFTNVDSSYLSAMRSVGARSGNVKMYELYPNKKWIQLLKDVTQLVKQLHSRDIRRQFCPDNHWLSHKVNIDPEQMRIDGFFEDDGGVKGVIQPGTSFKTKRHMCILRYLPFVVPFRDRVLLFQRIIARDRKSTQGDLHNFMMGPSIEVTAHRKYIYKDAFDQLTEDKAPNLKQAVRVRLINNQGLDEAGEDCGGLFREFLNEVLKAGFRPEVGLFKLSQESQLYHPNPQAQMFIPNYIKHYHFLGRMLGKALYENMLVELPLSSVFLCKLLSRHGVAVDTDHLESLDSEMYRNLLSLKDCGDVEDLTLNYTVVNNEVGETQEVELIPGGRSIDVTNGNSYHYIYFMADYRLNKQIRAHCEAFQSGLSSIIDLDLLRMFDHNELQVLISGAPAAIDLEDLRQHTNYSGGYTEAHPVVLSFWRVVSEFTDQQKRCLLKFVTSCSRPPLLGFSELNPAFCVQNAGDEDRLPSASTCFNLLKLPPFKDDQTMRGKVLYAIESGAGFELS